mmetsp:Transcript_14035/g.32331  ORF Transcript_14035/g.32331 Transcript_14035/m.32331 type:complete len:205 (-) Transcript_14035:273-887(-)
MRRRCRASAVCPSGHKFRRGASFPLHQHLLLLLRSTPLKFDPLLLRSSHPLEEFSCLHIEVALAGPHLLEDHPLFSLRQHERSHAHPLQQGLKLAPVNHTIFIRIELREKFPYVLQAQLIRRGSDPALHVLVHGFTVHVLSIQLFSLLIEWARVRVEEVEARVFEGSIHLVSSTRNRRPWPASIRSFPQTFFQFRFSIKVGEGM